MDQYQYTMDLKFRRNFKQEKDETFQSMIMDAMATPLLIVFILSGIAFFVLVAEIGVHKLMRRHKNRSVKRTNRLQITENRV